MKFIIDNKVYDTEKSTLICRYEEKPIDFFKIGRTHDIYATSKKKLFHVSYGPTEETLAEALDDKTGMKLLNKHCSGIIFNAYVSIFQTEEM